MSAFITAYFIVGFYYVLNDLFHKDGMATLVEYPKWVYFLGSTIVGVFWFPLVVYDLFTNSDEDTRNNRPGGPSPH